MYMRFQFGRFLKRDDGSSLIETAILLPFFLFMFVGVVDLGRAYYVSIELTSAAHNGALYGIQNPMDASGMQTASSQGASNLAGVSTTATYGCECSDGSATSASCSNVPSCTYNYVSYVDVVSSVQYVPIFRYPGLPGTMTFYKESRMRVGGN